MNFKRIICILYAVFMFGVLRAQSDLYIPKEIQKAYQNHTRSKDGQPGKKYWQNSVDYKIDVAITPKTRMIDGKENVLFTNNSPDDLSEIVIRLYYDVFKKGAKRGSSVNPKDIGEGVNIKKIIVEGVDFDLSDQDIVRRRGTNLTIKLPEPLKTGKQLNLEFEWQQKVPLTLRRTGAIDDTSFFVGYWYPQVAVYDDVFGWDRIDYTMDTEFYNNLANFDVNITVPNNFLVWATGTLENSKEVLPSEIYKKYVQAQSSNEVIHVVTEQDIKELKLKSDTWNFKATEVTDFAFAMSDHYIWDAASQEISGKRVLINSAFPLEKADNYKEITTIQQKVMKHFSEDIPGIAYPYPVFSTFIGLRNRGGGMEFPMMANNGGPGVPVTVHELFHTYFPMYVRINERRFAWMDEGWADFIETLVIHKFFSDNDNSTSLYSNFKLVMQGMIGSIGDLPTVTSSQYTGDSYGYQAYTLPSFTYALLYQYLGEELFLECFRSYVNRWAKKSPTPYDFFYTFEDVSGEDLSFFWNSWYFETGYPDLAIESLKGDDLVVKRIGDRIIPLSIEVIYKGSEGLKNENYQKTFDLSIWKNNNRTFTTKIPNATMIKSLVLNADFPDFNEVDNFFPSLEERYKEFKIDEEIEGEYYVEDYDFNLYIVKERGTLVIYSKERSWLYSILIPESRTTLISTDGGGKLTYKKKNSGLNEIELYYPKYNLKFAGKKRN
ncbi:M1 family metallopeptidase [Aquimarina sp. SS2-1]|uniref:M1 family metallopeptidase n=1 Tax=Aquimarina besae TaxID=3342247 RepID=UPI0036707474